MSKVVTFPNWVCIPHCLNPSIVASKKKSKLMLVVYYIYYISISISSHHLRVLLVNINHFPASLQNFEEYVNIVQVVQNFLGAYISKGISHPLKLS